MKYKNFLVLGPKQLDAYIADLVAEAESCKTAKQFNEWDELLDRYITIIAKQLQTITWALGAVLVGLIVLSLMNVIHLPIWVGMTITMSCFQIRDFMDKNLKKFQCDIDPVLEKIRTKFSN